MPHIAEINEAINSGSPMRWPEARRDSETFQSEVLNLNYKIEKKILAWLPEPVSFDQARGKSAPIHVERCGCESCKPPMIAEKTHTDNHRAEARLAGKIGASKVIELDFIFREWESEMQQVFNTGLRRSLQVGHDQGYRDIRAVALNEPAIKKERNIDGARAALQSQPEVLAVNYSEAYAAEILYRGGQLITSQITIAAKEEALSIISLGLETGVNWQEIARSLHQYVGTGNRYHWTRLVRTEILSAYDVAAKDRYTKAGAKYVRINTVADPCPICAGLRTNNKGFYPLGSAPALPGSTHPNCRCKWVPVWNLPPGVAG